MSETEAKKIQLIFYNWQLTSYRLCMYSVARSICQSKGAIINGKMLKENSFDHEKTIERSQISSCEEMIYLISGRQSKNNFRSRDRQSSSNE